MTISQTPWTLRFDTDLQHTPAAAFARMPANVRPEASTDTIGFVQTWAQQLAAEQAANPWRSPNDLGAVPDQLAAWVTETTTGSAGPS